MENNNSKLTKELIDKCERTKKAKEKRKNIVLTQDDIMKYEIASEIGLIDKVSSEGWAGLTAKEAGKIGGMLTSRKKKLKKLEEEQSSEDGSI